MVWSCMLLPCVSSVASKVSKPRDSGISVTGWRETVHRNAHAQPELQALLRSLAQGQIHKPTNTSCFVKLGMHADTKGLELMLQWLAPKWQRTNSCPWATSPVDNSLTLLLGM
eukprot:CAMPEP_0183415310 /NCGR_PEP_ID=MMETSP0370-20130417/23007_1 /TAXON_ID=268820 /ORGANISM="Peridinium aciculiferum, Strain PAER-2" /LENGTH=112 /DNA_ID=CAMNT_0025598721 /DNA_START=84 /DNA_END=419 /DNA_ORIENTATION=+